MYSAPAPANGMAPQLQFCVCVVPTGDEKYVCTGRSAALCSRLSVLSGLLMRRMFTFTHSVHTVNNRDRAGYSYRQLE